MSPITLERPAVEHDAADLLDDSADLLDEDDELLIEEISIDGMCGVY